MSLTFQPNEVPFCLHDLRHFPCQTMRRIADDINKLLIEADCAHVRLTVLDVVGSDDPCRAVRVLTDYNPFLNNPVLEDSPFEEPLK